MEKIKVRLYTHENDNYVEVWKEVGGTRYYARHTYCGSTWYNVCDPLGYCELDYPCKDAQVFVVCDQKGNPLFEDSNGSDFVFPTLEGMAKMEWAKVKDKYPTNAGLQNWLLSYMTTENLAKDPDRTQFCPDDNWKWCWHDRVDYTAVEEFEYLGEEYCIWKITQKHRYCDCKWVEYLAGPKKMDWEYPWFIHHFGDAFTPVFGPMYAKREAIELVSDRLKEIYEGKALSEIYQSCWGAQERKLSYNQAAERLIGNDLSRKSVAELMNKEQYFNNFYTSAADMRRDWPDYQPDLSMRWGI